MNTMVENNPNSSFITEDVGANDENREPFSDSPTKIRDPKIKHSASDLRKLSALPKELTASNWSKLDSEMQIDKSSKTKDRSKSSV